MNKTLLALPLIGLLSCGQGDHGSQPNDSVATAKATTDTAATATATTTTTPSNTDTVVWVGAFARWNESPTEQYDGNYDTANNVFIICGNHKSFVVPRGQITLQTNGNCDTSFSNRVWMIERTTKGNANILGAAVRLTDTTLRTGKAEIRLNPSEVVRLNRAIQTKKFIAH